MKEKNIHWYPGHMKRAQNEIVEKIKLVDVIIEVLDARAPFSSRNEFFKSLGTNKPHLILLNKSDLAAKPEQNSFEELKITDKDIILNISCEEKATYSKVCNAINKLAEDKNAKYIAKGMKPQAVRALIYGIPNVGKSSLINVLAKRKAAGVRNTPGFTRGEQWIKVNENFILLDTPGVLPSKYEDELVSLKLAVLGSMKDSIVPIHELTSYIFNYMKNVDISTVNEFFKIDINKDTNYEEFVEKVCRSLLFLNKNNEIDVSRCETFVLKKFQNSEIMKVYLD